MYSLINVRLNWALFTGVALFIYVLFPNISLYSYLAILISMHQFFLLFNSIGYVIPVRYLFGAFMCLQMLLGPMLAYNGLDQFQPVTYRMQIPEEQYFEYVIPAVCYFIIGLHAFAGKLKGEVLDQKQIENFVNQDKNIAYIFIAIGFVSSIISEYFSTNLAFVFYLLAGFKFIGAFMIILGNRKLKIIPLVLVFGSIISSSLGAGMFQDLLTWLIFLGMVFAIKYKPTAKVKRIATALFVLLALAIQQLKGEYREATWQKGEEAGLSTLSRAYEESQQQNAFFSYKSLASSNVRFNQGYIITNIIATVPKKVPFAEGTELYQILEAAFMPRFLAPDKLTAGNRDIFMKYSGMKIARSTSMGLSSVGDAYVNFGVTGGCIFMLFLGFFYNLVLQVFYKQSKFFPVLLLFTPLVFYYPIRPDCELQTILGHLVKSCFLIFAVFALWKKHFIIYPRSSEKDTHLNSLVPSGI